MSRSRWIEFLSDEDLAFVRRLVLASGSLKEIAKQYGVSYPTIRLRLDRLIAKIRAVEVDSVMTDFERILRAQFADQKLSHETFQLLLAAHLQDQEKSDDPVDPG
ncbi:MAG: DUF2089 family protein [Planctomycetaceae bacterium]